MVITLTACLSGRSQPTHYYTLPYTGDFVASSGQPDVGSLRLLEPEIASIYDRRQIVQRVSPTQIRYLPQELWAVRLSDTLGEAVRSAVEQSGLFSRVVPWTARADLRRQAQYALETEIALMEYAAGTDGRGTAAAQAAEASGAERGSAKVELTFRLRRNEGDVLVEHSKRIERALQPASPQAFVSVVAEVLGQELDAFFEKIAQQDL
jgi:uncharacterized lipoprotein YmbA